MKRSWFGFNQFVLLLLVFLLGACAALERAGDYVNDNPLVADLVVRQAVARYVEAGDTDRERYQRAVNVETVVERTQRYLDGNPVSSVPTIVDVISSQVDWDSLSPYDRLLVEDIMTVVQVRLEEKLAHDELPADTVLAVRSLLRTAVSAARLLS